jgi:hypothetical protein
VSDFFAGIAWLIPLCPLVGGGLAAFGPRPVRDVAHIPVVAGIALAFLLSLGLLFAADPEKTTVVSQSATSRYRSSFGSTA